MFNEDTIDHANGSQSTWVDEHFPSPEIVNVNDLPTSEESRESILDIIDDDKDESS